jgi:hypothetical protein
VCHSQFDPGLTAWCTAACAAGLGGGAVLVTLLYISNLVVMLAQIIGVCFEAV